MKATIAELRELYGVFEGQDRNLPSYEDIYPNRESPILRREADRLTLDVVKWGVPPPSNAKRPVTNVRNLESPFWRSMLGNPERRCLVPVTSFSEWEGEKGSKSEVWFSLKQKPLFCFAGVWRPADDGPCMAFLTCTPNDLVGEVHPKAMPVILDPDNYDQWLTGDVSEVKKLAVPYPDDAMVLTR